MWLHLSWCLAKSRKDILNVTWDLTVPSSKWHMTLGVGGSRS